MVIYRYMVEYIGSDGTKFIISEKVYVKNRDKTYYLLEEEYRDFESFEFVCWLITTGKIHDMNSLRRRIQGRFYLEHTNFGVKV